MMMDGALMELSASSSVIFRRFTTTTRDCVNQYAHATELARNPLLGQRLRPCGVDFETRLGLR